MQVGLDDLESPGDECDDCMKRATVTEWLLCVVRQKRGSDGEVSRAVLLINNNGKPHRKERYSSKGSLHHFFYVTSKSQKLSMRCRGAAPRSSSRSLVPL